MRKQMVEANRKRWDAYRDALMVVAETPARKWPQLERKVRIIGKLLLSCNGEWNDRLRAAVAADEAWLTENRPKRTRKGKAQ